MLFFKKRRRDPDEPLFGDISNRLFALGLDLAILYIPFTLLTHFILSSYFDVPNQFEVTRNKVLHIHPEYYDNISAIMSFISQNYPEDLTIIIRQLVFSLSLQAILLGLYVVPMTARYGGTIGKRIVGLKVVDGITGKNIGIAQATIRYITSIVSVACVGMGIIFGGFRHDKRTWHDLVADSYVVFAEDRWYKKYTLMIADKFKEHLNLKK